MATATVPSGQNAMAMRDSLMLVSLQGDQQVLG